MAANREIARTAPSPEEVFLLWLLHLPPETDVGEAAAREIERLNRFDLKSEGTRRLRELMVAAAERAAR